MRNAAQDAQAAEFAVIAPECTPLARAVVHLAFTLIPAAVSARI